ncbi:hypothetical protein [Leminorella grimontii]|uniref:hypothetical protein n=1 Tax=Leminorella grimontii TaxID=82981 RepID=UPI00106AE303|nr:hypothetical protein [Leminorella grimontii]
MRISDFSRVRKRKKRRYPGDTLRLPGLFSRALRRFPPTATIAGYCFDELGRGAFLGETVHAVPMIFLSPDEVFHHVRVGTTFRLWEGGFIAQGVVVGILPSSSATTVVHNNEYEE